MANRRKRRARYKKTITHPSAPWWEEYSWLLLIGTGLLVIVGFIVWKEMRLPLSSTPADAAFMERSRPFEISYGDGDAPVTMIEYASMSCPHCAAFHLETLPIIKKEYIDTGKVKLIFRDFPFNLPALQGSMITKCVGEDLYFKYLDALFSLQKKWVKSKGSRESLFNILSNTN